ncbi:MAG: pyruvate, phosphate dikinase [Acidobacteria bacterium]|nr:MAG: pyruvate, phosphate dikinase [Acidobacteriota bacterium]
MMKWVYGFGGGTAEGSGEQAELLGGKGAGLAEMSLLGIPVPPGFTVTTEACRHYLRGGGRFPDGLDDQLHEQMHGLEQQLGQGFGDPSRPLLVSVRSGAPVSMPGMMDTVLNLGLVRASLAADDEADARFRRDCFRRLQAMYGEVVLGIPPARFDAALREVLAGSAATSERDLGAEGLDAVVAAFDTVLAESGHELPDDPWAQLRAAIGAVFSSWNNRRAVEYRRLHDIDEKMGTGVTVQAMVFGNRGSDCATGVAFSRNPSTGERELYGEFLVDAQGEDVVAGTHTPQPIAGRAGSGGSGTDGVDGDGGLRSQFPEAYDELLRVCQTLERHFRNMQDLEFTIQHGKLYMLQTRAGKRSGPAAVRMAVEMVRERLIDRREAVRRVEPQHLTQMMAPVFDLAERQRALGEGRLLAVGLGAGPGAASGRIAFTAERASAMAGEGPVLLVRDETSPEDIVGMHAAAGILTTRGGMTSHAAVVARGMGKPCIVGADDLVVDEEAGVLRAGERSFREGESLSIDGTRGEILAGELATLPSEVLQSLDAPEGERQPLLVAAFYQLLRWADRERRLEVRANADTPEDARRAVAFGAQGIGLCRTEHMFFAHERIGWVRQMILADDDAQRRRALDELLPVQQSDFAGIFRALEGRPVTVRLLDPPLHEFLPHGDEALSALARQMGVSVGRVRDKAAALIEVNPMLGHRGCRLGITSPEIYEMQCTAIARAACLVQRAGTPVSCEIMIPLTGVVEEMARCRELVEAAVRRVCDEEGEELDSLLIGTMIEVPRAALIADQLARHADFFSFGTNDLTQMTFGFSRDDVGRFLPEYIEAGVIGGDPFARLDVDGVGQLVELASRRGRMARRDLKLGVCGEHGGDPHSIQFFERCRLDYVSCSPYRLPVARLAAARAAMAFHPGGRAEGLGDPLDPAG